MARKAQFDARKLMERAVAVMRKAEVERDDSGWVSPRVGAVIWLPDGRTEEAYRAENPRGEHAETILIERKMGMESLEGAILFTTLEPCVPEAQAHVFGSCAEFVVNAGIRKVYIGIEDDDIRVTGLGMKFLEDHGVEIALFDRDLQKQIRDANTEYIDQALGRDSAAHAGDTKPEKATVSLDGLSIKALNTYRKRAAIAEKVDSVAFAERLLRQGILHRLDGQIVPSPEGWLLFGEQPRDVLPQAGLLVTVEYPDGSEDGEAFEGPLVLMPEAIEGWLKGVLKRTQSRSQMQRSESMEFDFALIREPIVNGLLHRDYAIEGAKCQLLIMDERIVMRSPGGPKPPVTLEQLNAFNAPMLSRNPVLHRVFGLMKLAEERGRGMATLRSIPDRFGLPRPVYSMVEPYLTLTVYRSQESLASEVPQTIREKLSDEELKGWLWLKGEGSVSKSAYAKQLGIPARTAERHLKLFVDLKFAQRVGAGPATRYEPLL